MDVYRRKQGDCHADIQQMNHGDIYKYHCDDCERIEILSPLKNNNNNKIIFAIIGSPWTS